MNRTMNVNIRLTEAEYNDIHKTAKSINVGVSAYIRTLIFPFIDVERNLIYRPVQNKKEWITLLSIMNKFSESELKNMK